jgi:hypothetical protein
MPAIHRLLSKAVSSIEMSARASRTIAAERAIRSFHAKARQRLLRQMHASPVARSIRPRRKIFRHAMERARLSAQHRASPPRARGKHRKGPQMLKVAVTLAAAAVVAYAAHALAQMRTDVRPLTPITSSSSNGVSYAWFYESTERAVVACRIGPAPADALDCKSRSVAP